MGEQKGEEKKSWSQHRAATMNNHRGGGEENGRQVERKTKILGREMEKEREREKKTTQSQTDGHLDIYNYMTYKESC